MPLLMSFEQSAWADAGVPPPAVQHQPEGGAARSLGPQLALLESAIELAGQGSAKAAAAAGSTLAPAEQMQAANPVQSALGSTASVSAGPIGPNPGPGYVRLRGHVLPALALARLAAPSVATPPLSPQASAEQQTLALTLVLKRRDQAGFERYMREVYDPHSSRYRNFLKPAQLTRLYGPTRRDYQQVLDYLQANGFRLSEGSKDRMTITVQGTRADAERAFALHFSDYEIAGVPFYANDSDPAVPQALAPKLTAISGLSNLARPQKSRQAILWACNALHLKDLLEGGAALRGFAAMSPGYQAGIITGVAPEIPEILASIFLALVGVLFCLIAEDYNEFANKYPAPDGFGGNGGQWWNYPPVKGLTGGAALRPHDSTGLGYPDGTGQTIGLLEFDTFNTGDVSDFMNYITTLGGNPGLLGNLSAVPVNGGVATPGSGEGEVLLDIDTVMGIAPNAKVVVYDAPFDGTATSYSALFNAMIDGGVNVISNSWASCEDQVSQADAQGIDTVLQTAAAAGITVVNGTGDTGTTCLDGSANTISVPADSPNATAVGGTTLTPGPDMTYGSETWWDGSTASPPTGQGGYGTSRYFSSPAYQSGLNTSTMRSIPDVVAPADPAANGMWVCEADAGGCPGDTLNGGTSMAAPTWAALAALLNQTQGKALGALNPVVYPYANTDAFHSASSMGSDFAHVGLGSPNLNVLNRMLNGQTVGTPDPAASQVATLVGSNSLLSGTNIAVPADGTTSGQILVRLLDANGNTVSGKSVTITPSGGSAVVSPASAVTNVNNGAAFFTLTDLNAETVTFTVQDSTDGVTLATQPSITFGVPVAASGSLNAFPTSVNADGSSTTTLTVVLTDALGRPAPGKLVSISQGSGSSVISGPNPSVTDSTGQIQFTATDDVNETITYTAVDATDGNLPVPGSGTVTFSNAGTSDCTSNPAVGATGFSVSTFATGFAAQDFFYSNINISGCPGADSPYFDSSGSVLVADFLNGDVYQLPSAGGSASTGQVLANNLGPTIGTPVFGLDGSIYATRFATGGGFTTGDVIQIDPASGNVLRTLVTNLTCPNGLAVDPLTGDLFFDDNCYGGGSNNPSLWRLVDPANSDPNNPTSLVVYATLPRTGNNQISIAPNGTIFVASGNNSADGLGASDIVEVPGTNTTQPVTPTTLTGVTSDNGSVAIGLTNADGSAQTLVVHVTDTNNDGGTLETVNIDDNPPAVDTILATGDIGAGIIGPDGCYYVGAHHLVYKLAPSTGTCTLTPTNPAPSLSLTPVAVAPNPAQGSSQTFTASLSNVSSPAGIAVLFVVVGANPQMHQVLAGANGQASFSYTAVNSGQDTVVASATYAGPNTTLSAPAIPIRADVLAPAGRNAASKAATGVANAGAGAAPAGRNYPAVSPRFGTSARLAPVVPATGLQPQQTTGNPVTLTSNAAELTWTAGLHVSSVGLNTSPTSGSLNQAVTVVASLTDMSASPAAPVSGATIAFSLSSGANCTGTTNAQGLASCALTPSQIGPDTLTARFAGTASLAASSAATAFNVVKANASQGSGGGFYNGGHGGGGGAFGWPLGLLFGMMALLRRRRAGA